MLQQHGKGFEKAAGDVPTTKSITDDGINETMKKTGGTAARLTAEIYRRKLLESKDQLQVQAAKELFRYVNGDLKDESPKFIDSFLSALDGRTDTASQSAVYNALKSTALDQKKGGIFMIVCLADHQSGGVIRYANYLLKMLNVGGMDDETVKIACRALAFLIMTSKSYAAELVDRCLDQCQEWLTMQQEDNDRSIAVEDNRRLAAAQLSRELATFTPTAFFLRANMFFKYIFHALRDRNPVIRIAAVDALHSVLTITSQREAKQKTEWYKECFDEAFKTQFGDFPREEIDRYHSVAIVLNELLRISDSSFEEVRRESSQFRNIEPTSEDPIDWLICARHSEIVESATARQLVKLNFEQIVKCARDIIRVSQNYPAKGSTRLSHLNQVLMQLLPRICAYAECEANFATVAFETAFSILPRNSVAAPALGLMMLANPDMHRTHINKVMNFVAPALKKISDQDLFAEHYYTFLFLFVDAYNEKVTEQVQKILPTLLDIPLSRGLANVLKMIMMRVPKLRLNVQDGVMASVYFNLVGVPVPSKSEPNSTPPPPKNILSRVGTDPQLLQRVVLSIDTLGEFYFSRGALQRVMQYVADYYMVSEQREIRLASVKCCCDMIVPFMAVFDRVSADKKQHVLATIQGVLKALVSVVVVDEDVGVRMQAIKCFSDANRSFMVHLAQPEMLEVQFMTLHDERLEVQQACVTLLGRLAEFNPALVFPRMRRMLLETLSQLTNSGQSRLEQHSAKMIAQLAQQSPKFIRPYIGSLMAALIPKLQNDYKYPDVTTQALNAISELAVIGGAELVKNIGKIFKKLTQLINDSSNLQRREAALKAIGRICRATAYVVDPYKDFPTLLDDLLRLLKTVMSSSMRREAIKTLGILGAIDPYTHKVFTGSVQSAYAISTALSLPISQGDVSDPRQDIIQWFNYEKCTLEEFYPAITIANLMLMMQDEDSQAYAEIAQAIVTIFRSLGEAAPQYVEQVVPRLIEVCRTMNTRPNRAGLQEFFLRQLSMFVSIIKTQATPYMADIFSIISDAWNDDIGVKMCVVAVLEEMGTALGADFSQYIGELIPYLLSVLQNDKSRNRTLAVRVLEAMRPLCFCLVSHLHLVLPPVLIILDDISLAVSIRSAALDTILHMARNVDICAYAPRMMQSWHHCISTQEMHEKLLQLLIEIIRQLGKHFDVFRRMVDIKLRDNGLEKSDSAEIYRKLAQRAQMSRDVISISLFSGNTHANSQSTQSITKGASGGGTSENAVLGNNGLQERLMNGSMESSGSQADMEKEYYGVEEVKDLDHRVPTQARSTNEIMALPITKQRLNKDHLHMTWRVENLTSKEEWLQWLYKMRIAFLKSGSSPSLRAASSLGDQHPHLARDLFPAAFMSVWTELDGQVQDELAGSLRKALDTGYSDVIQTILNLAEFMDHSEKGPLPIEYEVLGKCAEKNKAYAKACRYKELQILKIWEETGGDQLKVEDCQALITFANKLNVQEEAAGVVRYAEKRNMNIKMRGRWYEKLNEWERALESYREDKDQADDVTMHEMRCLEALAQWEQLNEKARSVKNSTSGPLAHKVAVIAARGSWAVNDWTSMADYVSNISENTQDGAMLRAVVAVHNNEDTKAQVLIDKVRDMFDSELTALASESYERAYTPMVFVQQMAELEEAIEFKTRPERRPRIALLWSRRLQGCRQNVEQWQRLLMLRSLVLTPQEMHPLRVKFASLCRKQGKSSMSRAVLRELLNLEPDTDLITATPPNEKPLLVLALCKQLWQDDQKSTALATLEDLSKHLDRISRQQTEHDKSSRCYVEASRISAKVYLKLGEWIDFINKGKAMCTSATELDFIQQQISPPMRTRGFQQRNEMDRTIECYRKATQYDPKWHKAWHKLASAYFFATVREKKIQNSLPLKPRTSYSPYNPGSQSSLYYEPLPPPPQSNLSPLLHHSGTTSPIAMQNSPTVPEHIENAMNAIRCFSQALLYAPGSRLEDTLRLLQLWFDYGEHESVYVKLSEYVTDLPVHSWLEVVPQLMSRLDASDEEKPVQLIIKILVEIAKYEPQCLVYTVTVASRSQDKHRQKNAAFILKKMTDYHPELVKEAEMVTEELVRCAILWHEKWHDALDEASRIYYHEKFQRTDINVNLMYDTLRNLYNNVGVGTPTTMKEHSFVQTYQMDLREAHRYCMAYEKSRNVKDLNQAWEIYCQRVFKRLRDQLQNLTSLDLNYVSPNLVKAKDMQLAVPGTYEPSVEPVRIASFGNKLTVITSKQRPRKMLIRGSNGLEYQFLLKGHEDPRQDERVMQLFGLINTHLANNSDTCRRNLAIQRYSIVALSKDSGLIGWVPNCDTLHALVKEYREKKAKIGLSLEHKTLQKLAPDTEHLKSMQKLQLFEAALNATRGDDLRQILWLKSPSSEVWFDRRTNYTRSMACMSMVGYILGLGDRHPSNLMLDRLTGKIVHIDFGDCFEVAMLREKFPEKVPFRLTRMLTNAMEIAGLEGVYKYTAERVLKVLRSNQESLLAVLEAFVYDPVINWRLVEGMKRNPQAPRDLFMKVATNAPSSSTTEGVMGTIRKKLAGTELENHGSEPATINEQLEYLINQSTSHSNLCESYIGWCPFW